MKKPRQHIIETESKKQLNTIIPNAWVIRELSPDYGLDFMVEIFKNEESTGNIFYIQLKGSDQKITDDSISYSLKINHVEYYNSITSPVLLILYSTITKQFWGIWSNNLMEVLTKDGDRKKQTHKITLSKRYLINLSFFNELEKSFSNDLPKRTNIFYLTDCVEGDLFQAQIAKWLSHYFGNNIESNNNLLPKYIKFSYRKKGSFLHLSIENKTNKLTLAPINISNEAFLHFQVVDIHNCPPELKEVLLSSALLLQKDNLKKSVELISKVLDENTNALNPISTLDLVMNCINENLIFEVQKLSSVAIDRKNYEVIQYINVALLFNIKEEGLIELYRDNLLKVIESSTDNNLKATLCYNLANSYRSVGLPYLACNYYNKARKLNPDYTSRYYWWFELAGVLFIAGHYLIAENFYKKSLSLNHIRNLPLIYDLIGDCLYFQGRFKEANFYYQKFLSENPKSFENVYLKSLSCNYFIDKGIETISAGNEKSNEIMNKGILEDNEGMIAEATNVYPLNGLAWFNYGIVLSKRGDYMSAFYAFLNTVCIQDWDKEAWMNFIFSSINSNNIAKTIIIINAMKNILGREIINYIVEEIYSLNMLDKPMKLNLIQLVQDINNSHD